jgi:glycosyltransferase involved in cell wall biosynthesis
MLSPSGNSDKGFRWQMVMVIRLAFYTENRLIGGAERYLKDLIGGLDHNRYETVLFSNLNLAFNRYLLQHGLSDIQHRIIPIMPPTLGLATKCIYPMWKSDGQSKPPGTKLQGTLKEMMKSLWRFMQTGPNLISLTKAFRSQPIDILYINNGGYPGGETCRLSAIAAKWAKIPVRLMSVHNMAQGWAFPYSMERFIDRLVCDSLNLVIPHSNASRRSLEELRWFPTSKLRTVHYGIDDPSPVSNDAIARIREELGIGSNYRIVGMVANFEERKGHNYLLQAVPEIQKNVSRIKVILVGEGERRKAMMNLATKLGISDNVVFTGSCNDVFDLMATFDVLVLASVGFECLPFVIIEAMALGKPVVATTVAGIPEEVENGVTGILVPPADSASLAKAIISLLTNESMAKEMGTSGRQKYLRQFTLHRMIEDIEGILEI